MAYLPDGLAVEPSTPLGNLGRQTWARESGLPQNTVQALVQTRDGFLWLGTEAGLVRFDGIAFQIFDRTSNPALPGSDIRCLLESSDGSLWIGTSGGLARWKDGKMTPFTTQDGLPGNGILSLGQGKDGKLWLWTDQGPAQQSGARFVPVTNPDNFPHTALPSLSGDSGAQPFEQRLPDGVVVKGSRTELEFTEPTKSSGMPARLEVGRELTGSRIQSVLADREGTLWIGTNEGLVRWDEGKVERFPATDPLATASVLALMEDREHNLWVGTETDGLEILRDQRFHVLDTRQGVSSDSITTVVDDEKGTLWVGTQEDGLNAVHWNGNKIGNVDTLTVKNGLASDVILALAAAPNGDLWVGTPDGLNRIHDRNFATFTSVDGLPDDFIRSLLVDKDGSLWIGTRHGLTHWMNTDGTSAATGAGERMETFTKADGLGSDLVGSMTRDAAGDLWIATLSGLSRLHAGKIRNFTTADGLSSNVVTALLPRTDGSLLIGTQDRGWNLWDGHRFFQLTNNGRSTFGSAAIHAILDDGRDHLWFATGDGISRCTLGGAGNRPAGLCSDWLEFGTADGLSTLEMAGNSHPSAWHSRDGLLWFATAKGLVEVDPEHFPVNELAPPLVLERFAVDDVDEPLRGGEGSTRVKAGHVHFEFDYAGLSFTAPQKVRYRYRLVGFDRSWTEAGARRAAYYTNIPPGRYTFRVQAANNDGVWNTTGAAFSFELRPHFYQTLWFYILLVAITAGCVALLIRQRLRHAEDEFRAVLGERNRIAREIHDTLAQGYVGISAQLELLAELLRVRRYDDATERLNETRDYVREGLAEARQSIWALRTQDARETIFPVRLRREVETAGRDGLQTQFNTFGAYRPLPDKIENHLLRIAQEALRNVKKHAEAKKVSVHLEYGSTSIALEVRDDGRGVTSEETQAKPGHFGFTGMRERAETMEGTFEVSGVSGEGTTVRVSIPAPPVNDEFQRKSG
jgi:signal transduction histidine kinase/ligand-binding sensor domain-containing protein